MNADGPRPAVFVMNAAGPVNTMLDTLIFCNDIVHCSDSLI